MSSCVNARMSGPERAPRDPPAAGGATAADADAPPAGASPLAIGPPFAFRHDLHVRFNYQEARFEGVPDNFCALLGGGSAAATDGAASSSNSGGGGGGAFACVAASLQAAGRRQRAASAMAAPAAAAEINQQFGVPYRQLPRVRVPGYAERIPAVLEMLRHHFVARAGFRAPHIFRESPSKAERDQAVRDVNRGAFSPERHDVRVLADLVKVWFRELPVPILHEIPPADLLRLAQDHQRRCAACGPAACAPAAGHDREEDGGEGGGDGDGDGAAGRVLGRLGPLERSVLLWLADLLALVAAHQEENHMGVDQLAIVIAPNLVRIDCVVGADDPAAAVALSKAAVDLLRLVLRARFAQRLAADEDKENER